MFVYFKGDCPNIRSFRTDARQTLIMQYFQSEFEERCHTTGSPNYVSFFTATWSIIFLLFNIPGNLLVILAVTIDPYKNLRTPFNYLIANLACADLLVGTVTNPISVYIHFKEGLDLSLSMRELETLHMSYFISCTASVLSLGTLAVERYLAIRNPHTYRNKLTGKRILVTIASIWMTSLILPLIYFEVGVITYAFIFANTALVAVFGITCFIYGLMLKKFHERRMQYTREEIRCQSMIQDQASIESIPMNNTSVQERDIIRDSRVPANNALYNSALAMERKVTKTFLVVLIALLCCYGPSTVFIYVMSFCDTCRCKTLHWFRDLQFLFVIMNSSVNFYCYAIRAPRFRNAFKHILCIRRPDQNVQPATLREIRPTN